MTKQRFTPAYPAELRERGVRLFRESRGGYASDTAAYKAIAPKLGCSPDSLRVWCQQAERDAGQRVGLGSGLVVDHSQDRTIAARRMAEKKVCGQRSYRVATRRQSFNRPNMISMRLRRL